MLERVTRTLAKRRAEREAAVAYAEAERPVVAALRSAGLEIDGLDDLLRPIDYRRQIPVLVEWLGKSHNMDVREAIVRALSTPSAKPLASEPLVREFRALEHPELYRWTVGSALEALDDRGLDDVLLELALDRRYGRARQMVVEALARNEDQDRAMETLVQLLADEDVAGHATVALAALNRPEAAPYLRRMAEHPQAWIRTAARRGLEDVSP